MNDRIFQVSQNYFRLAKNRYVTSFIEADTNDFKIGETITFEETTHEGLQLTGFMLRVAVVNVGKNVKGLRKGYVIVSFALF